MIQRIQTVFLIISTILLGLLFLMPYAELAKDGMIYLFNYSGISLDGALKYNGYALASLIGILVILHPVIILNYKNRTLQIRLLVLSILLMLGLFGLFFFFIHFAIGDAEVSYKVSIFFPLIAIILDYMAIRAIGKDEALIRSIDRIR
jgi:hypothetical protein